MKYILDFFNQTVFIWMIISQKLFEIILLSCSVYWGMCCDCKKINDICLHFDAESLFRELHCTTLYKYLSYFQIKKKNKCFPSRNVKQLDFGLAVFYFPTPTSQPGSQEYLLIAKYLPGIVPSSVVLTAFQVMSRVFLTWAVTHSVKEVSQATNW